MQKVNLKTTIEGTTWNLKGYLSNCGKIVYKNRDKSGMCANVNVGDIITPIETVSKKRTVQNNVINPHLEIHSFLFKSKKIK